jgi:hypothetical protein
MIMKTKLTLIMLALVLPVSAIAGEWKIGVVDSGIGGQYSSLRLDKWGNAHVVYLDDNRAVLKYAFWDVSLNKWFTTSIDRSQGFCSMVLDSDQHPHVSYQGYGDGQLKYARWTGTTWEKQGIPIRAKNISFYTSIALAAGNRPSITYYEYENAGGEQELHLRDVTLNGSQWELRTVDPAPGSGKFNFIVSDSHGTLHVAYGNVKYENASLRYASWNGSAWQVEILEGAGQPGTSIWSTALVMDATDRPHIAYTDVLNRLVKYAVKVDGKWNTEVVGAIQKEGYPDRNGIALDEAGNPYISYYDAGAGVLQVAHKEGSKWVTEIVDSNFAGYTSSLQIRDGEIWMTYADESHRDLKFARHRLEKTVPGPEQNSKVVRDGPQAQ